VFRFHLGFGTIIPHALMKHPTFMAVIGGGLFFVVIRPPAAANARYGLIVGMGAAQNIAHRGTVVWGLGMRSERRSTSIIGNLQRSPALRVCANDRDRGEPLGSAPPTPPYIRVRIRRFEKLR
jgi:hypothetical protein